MPIAMFRGEEKDNDNNVDVFFFKFKLYTKLYFTPNHKKRLKYRFTNLRSKPVCDVIDYYDKKSPGSIEHSFKHTVHIENKYIYVFQRNMRDGSVKLRNELKGLSKKEQKFIIYNSKRQKVTTSTTLALPTKDGRYNIEYFFYYSSFPLADKRIANIASKINKSNGKAGKSEDNFPSIVGFSADGFTNYSPFNHILFSTEKDSDSKKRKVFTVYMTDTVVNILKIYNNFMECYSKYMDWITATGDEKLQKLIYIKNITGQIIDFGKNIKSKFMLKDHSFENFTKIGFNLEEINIELTGFSMRAMSHTVKDLTARRILENPTDLFNPDKKESYAVWSKSYDTVTNFYTMNTLFLGLGLKCILNSKEFRHQMIDFEFGSKDSGSMEYCLDDIESYKHSIHGFSSEEGAAIRSDLVGQISDSLYSFPGTYPYMKDKYEMAYDLLKYINEVDYNFENIYLKQSDISEEIFYITIFAGRKLTAGVVGALETISFLSLVKFKQEMAKVTRGTKEELKRRIEELDRIDSRYKNEIKLLEQFRGKDDSLNKRLAKHRDDLVKGYDKFMSNFSTDSKVSLKTEIFYVREALIKYKKQEILEILNKKLGCQLELDDVIINNNGDLLSVKQLCKDGKIRTFRSDHFTIVRDVEGAIQTSGLHQSLKKAEEDYNKARQAEKKVRKTEKQVTKSNNKIDGQKDKVAKTKETFTKKNNGIEQIKVILFSKKKKNVKKKNRKLEKIEEFSEGSTYFNLFFESLNFVYSISDFLIKVDKGELKGRDIADMTGATADFTASLLEAISVRYKQLHNLGIFKTGQKSAKLMRYSRFFAKVGLSVGVFSSAIDTVTDMVDAYSEWEEGDFHGTFGETIAAFGGATIFFTSWIVIISMGTLGPLSATLLSVGVTFQLLGNLYAELFGNDHYDMWIRHSCWGKDFGQEETKLEAYKDKAPSWCYSPFVKWRYDDGQSESSERLGWAGELDSQIASYHNLFYDFFCHFSAASRIHADVMRARSTQSIRFEKKFTHHVKTGYIELNLDVPPISSGKAVFVISIWLEKKSSGNKRYIMDSKRLHCLPTEKVELIGNDDLSPEVIDIIGGARNRREYISTKIKDRQGRDCLCLQFIDSEVKDDDRLSSGSGFIKALSNTYKTFFDYDDSVFRIENLRKDFQEYESLCLSVYLDLYDDGKAIIPQFENGEFGKFFRLPLSEIKKHTAAITTYTGSEPFSNLSTKL